MITIKNVKALDGEIKDHTIPSLKDFTIDAEGKLFLLPGIIDPHICFGSMDSQDWNLAIESVIRGGITTAIEIPSKALPHNTKQDLEQKNIKIAKGLLDLEIPIHYLSYLLYSGSNLEEIDQLGKEKRMIKGIVIQLDEEKRELLDDNWESLFRLAAQEDVPVVINSCNENTEHNPKTKAGESLLEKAIYYIEKWGNRLYVLNVATQKEIDLIQEARNRSLLIYCETTPQHLFPDDLSQANHLWEALNNNVIETIGSGYDVNHQGQVRALYKGGNFSLSDPIFFLPFLLNAVNEKKISLDKLVQVTGINILGILEMDKIHHFVLVDLEKKQTIQKINSGHSTNTEIKGWPIYTIIEDQIFFLSNGGYKLIGSLNV